MKPKRSRRPGGFTLIEVLVALMVAGLLTAMIASLMGRSVVASSALEEASQGRHARMVLRRMLAMDIRNMPPDAEFQVTENGFALATSHNHLIPGPLPITATWTFSESGIVRNEEQPDLGYLQTLVVSRSLEQREISFFDLTEGQWMDAQSWLRMPDRPAPAGLRLRLVLDGVGQVEIIERLPLQAGDGTP